MHQTLHMLQAEEAPLRFISEIYQKYTRKCDPLERADIIRLCLVQTRIWNKDVKQPSKKCLVFMD